MQQKMMVVLGIVAASAGCGNGEPTAPAPLRRAVLDTANPLKIGLTLAADAPASADFLAAARLAERQLNDGFARAGAPQRFQLVVSSYAAGDVQSPAIALVNEQAVLGIVTDTSDAAALVDALNYELTPRIAYRVPVTCHQCSSIRINDGSDTAPGFADVEGWLFRTFFNERFELPLQVRLLQARPRGGDFNGDGHLKVVVYFDPAHAPAAAQFSAVFDALAAGSHSTQLVMRSGDWAFDQSLIFADPADPRAPDLVVMAFSSDNLPLALGAFRDFAAATKPPVQLTDEARRDWMLPVLLASGVPGLEGLSALRVSGSPSGPLFRSAFTDATGHPPEMTASFLYDAVVVQAIAMAWADHFGSRDTQVIAGNFFNVNDPSGLIIRPRAADFATLAQRIQQELPVNYDGASSAMDLDFLGDNFPELVHWKLQTDKFAEAEIYRCDNDHPTCVRR